MIRRMPCRTPSPSLRPLARSLLLALAALPTAAALAGELDGTNHTVVAGDPSEDWRVRNGGELTLASGAQAGYIQADEDSRLVMDGATVTRPLSGPNAASNHSVRVFDDARLEARNATFLGGGVFVAGASASAHLVNSRIFVSTAGGHNGTTTGIDITSIGGTLSFDPSITIEGTQVQVEDASAATRPLNSGIGARMTYGRISILNGSYVEGANVGALILGLRNGEGVGATPPQLLIDDSTVKSGRDAAIRVANRDADSDVEITVANGSNLIGGDGNLLLVKSESGLAETGVTAVNFTVDDSRLAGDVTLDRATAPNSTLDLILRNKAQIDGRFTNVTSADISSDSTWLMTGDSNVGALTLGNTGIVALGNGSTFNTLNVDTFTGNGGTLLFNTQLGDDTSATDKLIVAGDTSGQANVRVVNAGGAGAKTDKGIELIRVGGASNGQFDLQGRAVGGQYEYFLFKDATNGGWYLRSELATVPDPCVVDPTLPECGPIIDPVDPVEPTPVLRPETGAYLANQFAVDQLLRHGWRDRQGGSFSDDGVRGWARVDSNQSKLGAVNDQLDLRVDRSRVQLGADMGVFDNGRGRVGVMGTLAQSSATSRSELTGYSAKGKVQGGALGVYGSWNNDAMYLDASVQRGQFRNRVQGEGLAEERYDSDIWQSALEAGYRIGIGQIGSTAVSLQPELQLIYTNTSTDRHEEANGTVVRALDNNGLSGRLGLRLQGEGQSTAGASVSPYVVANWYRDGANNGIAFDDEVLKAGIPRNRYELSAGARVQFRSGLSAWGGFGVMHGDQGYREATGNLSVAYKW
ncbi:autotransporter outer membrane beta-barrel domain-containing protein [Stenotrophomonas maltophilia]|uniref:Autotransporter outer membrane beta-barrel domain-containing protein n=1 Tax=Stenotrophomonas maltophilia TaxID=40324 RepID=A0AAJ2J815_STEMA|nr:autotransporter outer membrane beta-barrel domain-containing protein [Stenotrophomonas maltophilia]MDT3466585.1 autotransporter outer membrane beta-barrel domain-containing protein [Stenotrophomonas maltophilia]